MLQARALLAALGGTFKQQDAWLDVFVARQQLRFLIGAPVRHLRRQDPAAGLGRRWCNVTRPTSRCSSCPTCSRGCSRNGTATTSRRGRLMDAGWQLVKGTRRAAHGRGPRAEDAHPGRGPAGRDPPAPAPGHGRRGARGRGSRQSRASSSPAGLKEKDVTLQMSLLLRDELRARGITVRMTRTARHAHRTRRPRRLLHRRVRPLRQPARQFAATAPWLHRGARLRDVLPRPRPRPRTPTAWPTWRTRRCASSRETEASAEQQGLDFILKDLADQRVPPRVRPGWRS